MGTISLGIAGAGKRRRRTVRGKTKTEVKDKLDALHEEIKAGIQTPAERHLTGPGTRGCGSAAPCGQAGPWHRSE